MQLKVDRSSQLQCNAGEKEGWAQGCNCNCKSATQWRRLFICCLLRSVPSFSFTHLLVSLETHLTWPSPPLSSPAPCKLVHLSVQRFNLLQFFWLPQRSRTEVCSSSCRQAPFLVAFRSGYLDLLLRQIRLMWCALGARGSYSAAFPRAPIPNFDEALPLWEPLRRPLPLHPLPPQIQRCEPRRCLYSGAALGRRGRGGAASGSEDRGAGTRKGRRRRGGPEARGWWEGSAAAEEELPEEGHLRRW